MTTASPLRAQEQEAGLEAPLVASGLCALHGQDLADVRDRAFHEALRAALEQALGRLLPAERIVRYYALLNEKVLANPLNYVKDYQIIHESREQSGYRVTVHTRLYGDSLHSDLQKLGMFLADSERPRLAFLVAERSGPAEPWHFWWSQEPAATELLFQPRAAELCRQRGLVPLEPELLRPLLPPEPRFQQGLLADADAIDLGRALGADLVLVGQVEHDPASSSAPATARAQLRALLVSTGEIVARADSTVQVQASPAEPAAARGFAALADRVIPGMVEPMLAPFTIREVRPREVVVDFAGINSSSELFAIKEHLQSLPSVSKISSLTLEGDRATFTLLATGTASDLAAAIHAHDFGTFVTTVVAADESRVSLQIVTPQ